MSDNQAKRHPREGGDPFKIDSRLRGNDMENVKGFSLLELMLALAIIGILTLLSLPTYSHYIAREKRFETEVLLTQIAATLENYFTQHNSYQGATLESLGFADNNDRYELSMQMTPDEHFILVASANEKQAQEDIECVKLTLNDAGEKNKTDCWR
jgi:type IV pilus assembly protein PilE